MFKKLDKKVWGGGLRTAGRRAQVAHYESVFVGVRVLNMFICGE